MSETADAPATHAECAEFLRSVLEHDNPGIEVTEETPAVVEMGGRPQYFLCPHKVTLWCIPSLERVVSQWAAEMEEK